MSERASTISLALLDLMLADMEAAPALYRPTAFWRQASAQIVDDLRRQGVENFRRHASAAKFYVPQYEHVVHRESPQLCRDFVEHVGQNCRGETRLPLLMEQLLEGRLEALSDFRAFRAAETEQPPRLDRVSESDVGQPAERLCFEDRSYSRSMLNYLRGLVFLKRHVATEGLSRVLEIGGGFGTLGEILLKADPPRFYVNCDIPPLAFVSSWYLQQVFGAEAIADYGVTRDMDRIDLEQLGRDYRAVVLCAWQLPRVVGQIDLFVNFISFQEMEPPVVRNYIEHVQRLGSGCVLLRNLREGMRRQGACAVNEPITADDYLQWFAGYEPLARDSLVYGQQNVDGFQSEVMILRRRDHPSR